MKLKNLAISALLASLFAFNGCSHPQPVMNPQRLPAELSPAELQGYKDGVNAAEHDIRLHEPPDLRKHLRFRNPPVPTVVAREYRQEFRAGYEQAIHGGPLPPGY